MWAAATAGAWRTPHGPMQLTTLMQCHVQYSTQLPQLACMPLQVRLPSGEALDVTLSLSSGAASSGLLGTTSLTYQVGMLLTCSCGQSWHANADGRMHLL